MIGLILFHDGRNEYLKSTLNSFVKNVMPIPEYSLIVNDSSDIKGIEIAQEFGFSHCINTGGNYGIFRSIELGWDHARNHGVQTIWHQENDFVFDEKIDVKNMLSVIKNHHVMQCALKRQAWYKHEIKYGDFMKYLLAKKRNCLVNYSINGVNVVTHREFFTNNPSVYHLKNMPTIYRSEYSITKHFENIDKHWTCTFLGHTNDRNLCTHIGAIKA